MQWAKKAEKSYVVLSSNGKLYSGFGQSPIKEVMDDVDAGMFPLFLFLLIVEGLAICFMYQYLLLIFLPTKG